MDVNSLSHTRWECKYHILFAPKFRRKVAYGELKQDIANILSMLCKRKGVEIIEAEICPDHVHMLVRIPPSMSVSNFVGYLKGKSTLMILLYGRYDTKQMTIEELKTLIWRYFIIYWNRRICSANGGLHPMTKRKKYYESLGQVA